MSGPLLAEKQGSTGDGAGATNKSAAPGFLRRLAAIFYDWLLLVGVMIVASLPLIWILGGAPANWATQTAFRLYLLAITYGFFAWFWTHGGQTLGMRVWRLRVVSCKGGPVSWQLATWRFLAALASLLCLGLGFLWVMHDRERRAWHDRLSGTRLELVPKRGEPG